MHRSLSCTIGAFFVAGVLAPASAPASMIDLGSAGDYAGAALNGQTKFTISSGNTAITGDVFVGSGGNPALDFGGGGSITGSIFRDPTAVVNISGGSTAFGGIVTLTAAQSNQVTTDLQSALAVMTAQSANQTFSGITSGTTITATVPGLNVIDVTGNINLQGGSMLTFSGPANDMFLVRVAGSVTAGGGSQITSSLGTGGASNIIFDILGGDLDMNGNSYSSGTYITTNGGITISGGTHDGAFIMASPDDQLKFQSGPTINYLGASADRNAVPEPASLALLTLGGAMIFFHRGPRAGRA